MGPRHQHFQNSFLETVRCSQAWEPLGVSARDLRVILTKKVYTGCHDWNCKFCIKMFPTMLFLEKFLSFLKLKIFVPQIEYLEYILMNKIFSQKFLSDFPKYFPDFDSICSSSHKNQKQRPPLQRTPPLGAKSASIAAKEIWHRSLGHSHPGWGHDHLLLGGREVGGVFQAYAHFSLCTSKPENAISDSLNKFRTVSRGSQTTRK